MALSGSSPVVGPPSTDSDLDPALRGSRACTEIDLTRRQLEGIARWHEARRGTGDTSSTGTSREARMDLARRSEVVRAEHRALVERTDAQLRSSTAPLRSSPPPRAIIVHRNAWFSAKVHDELVLRSVHVVTTLVNGAEAVGAVVAEQPDLLLVEDSLPMLSGEDVVREVRRFAPDTLIAAQVAYDDRIARMLDAGAHTAYTRRVSPVDVARSLSELVAARG